MVFDNVLKQDLKIARLSMKKYKGSYRYINYIFSFSLVIVFVVLMSILIYSGANSYKNIKNHTDMNFNAQTALGYVVNKVHGNDTMEIRIGEETGIQYICLNYDGGEYVTYVYCYEGNMYEYLTKATNEFEPGMGEKICQLSEMVFEQKRNDLLKVTLKDDVSSEETYLYVNCGIEKVKKEQNSVKED